MVTPYYKRHNRTSECSFWFNVAFSLFMYVNGMANLYKMRMTSLSGNEDQLKAARKKIVDTNSWRYCEKCGEICPPRSHHCPLCDVCVLRRDHHCWFAGCCVGISNHRCVMSLFFINHNLSPSELIILIFDRTDTYAVRLSFQVLSCDNRLRPNRGSVHKHIQL